jgi:hypothetical protein
MVPRTCPGLDALGDHCVDAGRGRRSRLLGGPDLDEDLGAMAVCDVDVGRRVAPEQDDCCHTHRGDGIDLLHQVLAVAGFGLGDDDVDAEGLVREGPRAGDAPGQCVEWHRPAAEHAQGAGVGDGGSELGNGRRADTRVQDGMAYLEQVAHGGVEGSRHSVIVMCGEEIWYCGR